MIDRSSSAASGASGVDASHRFRPDVEGLRAVAVLMVLWYHAGLRGVSGGFAGVDVFFVISGFLITGLLVREVEATGRISLPMFYARRAKRLFPAAATVLVTTCLLTFAFIPKTQWSVFGGDIASAAAYVVNWRLAARSVDYLAEGLDLSPVQHFWSLAVEEQFYIVWPLLLILLVLVIRRWKTPVRPTMAVGLALITIPSFVWSVVATAQSPASAYFVTTTRLWELGIGALVAVAASLWPRIPAGPAAAIGWLGLLGIVGGALVQSTATPWPGSAALVPTLGAAAVIVSGYNSGPRGPVAILGMRPAVWIGGLSYSLYLWHWPLLIAATAYFDEIGEKIGLAVVLFSFLPAWLTYRLVENPFRKSRSISRSPRLALSVGLNFSLVGVAAGLALVIAALSASTPANNAAQAQGAALLGSSSEPDLTSLDKTSDGVMTPAALKATEDVPEAYADQCHGPQQKNSDVDTCAYGAKDSDFTVALVGDSKALQWLPALDTIGEARGWRVETYSKSTCSWTAAMTQIEEAPFEACHAWGESVARHLTDEPVDLIVTSNVRQDALAESGDETAEALADGYVRYWEQAGEEGTPVLALANNPGAKDMQVYECVAEHPDGYMDECAFPYERTGSTEAMMAAVDELDTAGFVDLDPWMCPDRKECPPVIGDVLVYRQGSHITRTYAESVHGKLEKEIEDFLKEQGVAAP